MGKIVVEFGTPHAKTKAKEWKKEVIAAITKAIASLKVPGRGVMIFEEKEFSVYYTFER